jgi:hypothetical protein
MCRHTKDGIAIAAKAAECGRLLTISSKTAILENKILTKYERWIE